MLVSYQWFQTAIRIAENVEDFLSLTAVNHYHEQDQLNPSQYEVVYPEPEVYEEDKFTFLEINSNPFSDRDDGDIEYELELGHDGEWHFNDKYDPINWESNIYDIDD